MKKNKLLMYAGGLDTKIVLGIKGDLYSEFQDEFPANKDLFVVDNTDDLLNLFEKLVIILIKKLDGRKAPEPPKNLYVPEDQIYVDREVFGKQYRFLQGHQIDGQILQLLEIRNLVKSCIKSKRSFLARFIERNSEAFFR